MDEDIFVTPGMFEELMQVYLNVQKEKKYEIGIVAPQMTVNGYSYCRILDYLKCREEYEKIFGDAYYGRGSIYFRGEAAEYVEKNASVKSICRENEGGSAGVFHLLAQIQYRLLFNASQLLAEHARFYDGAGGSAWKR